MCAATVPVRSVHFSYWLACYPDLCLSYPSFELISVDHIHNDIGIVLIKINRT